MQQAVSSDELLDVRTRLRELRVAVEDAEYAGIGYATRLKTAEDIIAIILGLDDAERHYRPAADTIVEYASPFDDYVVETETDRNDPFVPDNPVELSEPRVVTAVTDHAAKKQTLDETPVESYASLAATRAGARES